MIVTIPAEGTTEEGFTRLFSRNMCLRVEVAYSPWNTPLILAARRHEGWRTVPGVEILLYQAFDQSRLCTGRSAPREVMEKAVEEHVQKIEAYYPRCKVVK